MSFCGGGGSASRCTVLDAPTVVRSGPDRSPCSTPSATSVRTVPFARPASTSAVIVTDPVAPGATAPTAHVTTAPAIVQPSSGRGVSPAPSVSDTTTPVAVDGPWLTYAITYSAGAAAVTVAGPVLVTATSARGTSGSVTVDSLSGLSGSSAWEPTRAVLVSDPVRSAATRTSSSTSADAPTKRSGTSQLTMTRSRSGTASQVSVGPTNSRPGASVSLIRGVRATDGPRLTTVNRNCTGPPRTTGSVTTALVISVSATSPTSTAGAAELLVVSGSRVPDVATSVLTRSPGGASGAMSSTSSTLTVSPAANRARVHVTWPAATAQPAGETVCGAMVVNGGGSSVTTRSTASEGPLLLTVIE